MSDFDEVGTVAFFRERRRAEAITTSKVLRAMTPEMMDYRFHSESSTLGAIAWTIVRCLQVCVHLTHNQSAEVPREPPPRLELLQVAFDEAETELGSRLLGINQETWLEGRIVTDGPRTILDRPLGQILWLFHADAIHHRGQISVFLRSFGAKVPSIYGPSGDSQS